MNKIYLFVPDESENVRVLSGANSVSPIRLHIDPLSRIRSVAYDDSSLADFSYSLMVDDPDKCSDDAFYFRKSHSNRRFHCLISHMDRTLFF